MARLYAADHAPRFGANYILTYLLNTAMAGRVHSGDLSLCVESFLRQLSSIKSIKFICQERAEYEGRLPVRY